MFPKRCKTKADWLIYFQERTKVNSEGCWVWQKALSFHGYGAGPNGVRAHRLAYKMLVGPIPEGLVLMHSCDRPACVNPEHLTPGTQAENMKWTSYDGVIPKCNY